MDGVSFQEIGSIAILYRLYIVYIYILYIYEYIVYIVIEPVIDITINPTVNNLAGSLCTDFDWLGHPERVRYAPTLGGSGFETPLWTDADWCSVLSWSSWLGECLWPSCRKMSSQAKVENDIKVEEHLIYLWDILNMNSYIYRYIYIYIHSISSFGLEHERRSATWDIKHEKHEDFGKNKVVIYYRVQSYSIMLERSVTLAESIRSENAVGF